MNAWKTKLLTMATVIVVLMIVTIVYASLERGVFDNAHLMKDVWFQTTLIDLYCAFGVIYAWVAFRERTILARLVWLIAIVCLGSLGIGLYLMYSLVTAKAGTTFSEFLAAQKAGT